jgi:hypothetical protein
MDWKRFEWLQALSYRLQASRTPNCLKLVACSLKPIVFCAFPNARNQLSFKNHQHLKNEGQDCGRISDGKWILGGRML